MLILLLLMGIMIKSVVVGASQEELSGFGVEMQPCWKGFLLNQFHDVIPGSCIEQVVTDAMEIYQGKQKLMIALTCDVDPHQRISVTSSYINIALSKSFHLHYNTLPISAEYP